MAADAAGDDLLTGGESEDSEEELVDQQATSLDANWKGWNRKVFRIRAAAAVLVQVAGLSGSLELAQFLHDLLLAQEVRRRGVVNPLRVWSAGLRPPSTHSDPSRRPPHDTPAPTVIPETASRPDTRHRQQKGSARHTCRRRDDLRLLL